MLTKEIIKAIRLILGYPTDLRVHLDNDPYIKHDVSYFISGCGSSIFHFDIYDRKHISHKQREHIIGLCTYAVIYGTPIEINKNDYIMEEFEND